MEQEVHPIKPGYYGYPVAKESPKSDYTFVPGNNPVLRGWPLVLVSTAIAKIDLLAGFFWSNVGFAQLRRIKHIDGQEPRYDPTVIPVGRESGSSSSSPQKVDLQSYMRNPGGEHRPTSAGDYQASFKSGTSTPTTVATAILELISASPKHRTAFLDIKPSLVLAAAEASTARWKAGKPLSALDGVPIAVKDEVDIEGYQKTLGSRLDFTPTPNVTSWCVAQWEAAGAVIVGKTNMHELGISTTNNNADGNTPLNPHNSQYYCGGSSGGSGYAVAAGLVPIALGVDAGGSIRIPSAYCGLYGLKPTHGRVSRSPTPSVCTSMAVVGPMAATMADLELAYRIMATPNPSDDRSSHFPVPTPIPSSPSSLNPRILGIFSPYFNAADPPVLNACHPALARYQSLGYTLQEIHLPYLPEGQLAHAMTILSEFCSATTTIPSPYSSTSNYAPHTRLVLAVGAQTPATDLMLAQKLRHLLMQHLANLWQRYPGMLIVTPTTANGGWFIEGGASDVQPGGGISDANMELKAMTYVWLANFTGCPALTVPVGRVDGRGGEGKVPVGMMAMGEWGDEEGLLEWGRAGEEWCWGEGGVGKPEGYVDVIEAAGRG